MLDVIRIVKNYGRGVGRIPIRWTDDLVEVPGGAQMHALPNPLLKS